MDFFESQARARRKSLFLVAFYLFAVICTVLGVYFLVSAIMLGTGFVRVHDHIGNGSAHEPSWWNPHLFVLVTVFSIALVLGGTVFKLIQLAKGGRAVAELLGGRLISATTKDPNERKVLNVVEEMAIASGTPVPPVYLLDKEESINAFAAGYQSSDAVVGVTKGCIEHLSRDELQGVIAHEFSHILNGDMNLNIRLIGIAHGLLTMARTGYLLLRVSSNRARVMRARRKSADPRGFLIILGLALLALGSVGFFLARLMKAAVSREREYLADASAVQFTRNPDGIAGALKKIGGFAGSKLEHPKAEEASHLYFSDGISAAWANLLATHPPLVRRIQRIDPSFTKKDFITEPTRPVPDNETLSAVSMLSADSISTTSQEFMETVGQLTPKHLQLAKSLLAAIPAGIRERAHDTLGARAIVYALLIDADEIEAQAQLEILAKQAEENELREMQELLPEIRALNARQRLPLLDLCLPCLRELSLPQYTSFRNNVEQLVLADGRYTLFEYALLSILRNRLDQAFGLKSRAKLRSQKAEAEDKDAAVLLSALAHLSQGRKVSSAFERGKVLTGLTLSLLPREECRLEAIDRALQSLCNLPPSEKKRVLNACAETVLYDEKVEIKEAELLRAIGERLECPIPPFLSGDR